MTVADIANFLDTNKIVKECLIAPSGRRASCEIPVLNSETKEKIGKCTLWLNTTDKGIESELWCSKK